MAEVRLTKEGVEKYEKRLEYLKTTGRTEIAEQIKIARSFGDLSENSEYDEAKNEQGRLFSREAEVQAILDNYILIEEDASDDTVISLGCTVTVLDLELDEEEEYRIVGSQEADPMNGRISEESPFGKALMGKEVGDEVTVEAPMGSLSYRVVNIAVNR